MQVITIQLAIIATILLIWSGAANAKGKTVRIEVTGGDLIEQIQITEAEIVSEFHIWAGPGTSYSVRGGPPQTDCRAPIIDFCSGAVSEPPADLPRYEIQIFIAWGSQPGKVAEQPYRLTFAINKDGKNGYLFLPHGNPFIHHGVEGNWFQSTPEWTAKIVPIIRRSQATNQSSFNGG